MGLIYSPRFIIFGALGTVLLNQVPVRREDTYGQRQIRVRQTEQTAAFFTPQDRSTLTKITALSLFQYFLLYVNMIK